MAGRFRMGVVCECSGESDYPAEEGPAEEEVDDEDGVFVSMSAAMCDYGRQEVDQRQDAQEDEAGEVIC